MKSFLLPVAKARSNFSDAIAAARNGQRIRLTRHGKPVCWMIGEADHALLQSRRAGGSKGKLSGGGGIR